MSDTTVQGKAATSYPNTVTTAPAQQWLFFVGMNGQLIRSWWDGLSSYEDWQSDTPQGTINPVAPTSDPIAMPLTMPNGTVQLHVHFRGPDGMLWHTFYDSANWITEKLQSQPMPAPMVNLYGSGRLLAGANYRNSSTGGWPFEQHVFYPGADGSVYQTWWDGNNWNNSFRLPGPIAAGAVPAVLDYASSDSAADNPAEQWVFYTGSDGLFQRTWWNGSMWDTQEIGLAASGPPSAGGYLENAPYNYELQDFCYRTTGDVLQQMLWNGSSWVPQLVNPSPPNQQLLSEPLAADCLNDNNGLTQRNVFYIGYDGALYWAYATAPLSTSWQIQNLGLTPQRLLAVQVYDGALHVFFRAGDGTLQQTWQNEGQWTSMTINALSPPTLWGWQLGSGGSGCSASVARFLRLFRR